MIIHGIEIIARAKREPENDWIYGDIHRNEIIWNYNDDFFSADWHKIQPDTIGKPTGFLDKNNIEIFEGDILSDCVETETGFIKSHKQVFWNQLKGRWDLDESFSQDKSFSCSLSKDLKLFHYEISGNIHDNPELIPNQNEKVNQKRNT
jgi:uncharacterized phage protein (TIGR01671 family)